MNNLILTNEQQGVFTVTINRFDKKNALDSSMYLQLYDALNYASSHESIRCFVIQGNEQCFSAGNDLQDFIENGDDLVALKFINALAEFKKPLVAAVAGVAVGVGTTMLLHCDMVIAADNSKFKLPFTQLGLCPEAGSSYILSQRLGYNKAFELLVLGNMFSASQAQDYGIVNQVTSPEEVLATAQNIAETIAKLPVDAVATSRALIRQGSDENLKNMMQAEAKEFARLVNTPDCKAILASFFK